MSRSQTSLIRQHDSGGDALSSSPRMYRRKRNLGAPKTMTQLQVRTFAGQIWRLIAAHPQGLGRDSVRCQKLHRDLGSDAQMYMQSYVLRRAR